MPLYLFQNLPSVFCSCLFLWVNGHCIRKHVTHKFLFFLFFLELFKMESTHGLAKQCLLSVSINTSVPAKMIILKESLKKFCCTGLPYSNSTNCFKNLLNEFAVWWHRAPHSLISVSQRAVLTWNNGMNMEGNGEKTEVALYWDSCVKSGCRKQISSDKDFYFFKEN